MFFRPEVRVEDFEAAATQPPSRDPSEAEDLLQRVYLEAPKSFHRFEAGTKFAYLPGESQPVFFSVHGAVAKHYKTDPAALKESHASTLDYVIAATAG